MGDSGGPFVCKGSNNKWVLHGAVSWGTRTCSAGLNQYTIFARVSVFVNWIRKYIGTGTPQTPRPPQTPPPPVTPPPDTLPPTPPRPNTPPIGTPPQTPPPVTPPKTLPPTPPRPNTPPSVSTPPNTLPPTPLPNTPPTPCLSPKPLGLQNKDIPDSAISSSTQVNRWHSAREARLHLKPGITGVGAWCSRDLAKNEYLEIDLGAKITVTGVATQGRESKHPKFVKSYAVLYSDDGNVWTRHPTIFTGNVDMSTVTTNSISPPIRARYIRINPQSWHVHICMRAELYGCPVTPTTTQPPSTTTNSPKTTTTQPTTVTDSPRTTTDSPVTTTDSPKTTTDSPVKITDSPKTTTDSHKTSTTSVTPSPKTQQPTPPPLPPTPPPPPTQPPTTRPGIKTIPPNPIGIKCQDLHPFCTTWAKEGKCNTDDWVKRNCLKSCNSTQCDREPVRPFAPCSNRLGLGWDNKLPDSSFTASSKLTLGAWDYGARNARMYFEDNHTYKRVGAWCAESNKDQWLQVDLGTKTYVTAVATQGRHKYFEHVKTFKLSHSIDGTTWEYVKDDSGSEKVFTGNCDHFTPVINSLPGATPARYVRFHPVTANYVCMRVEIYGCT